MEANILEAACYPVLSEDLGELGGSTTSIFKQ
jgi:hypothetical protein